MFSDNKLHNEVLLHIQAQKLELKKTGVSDSKLGTCVQKRAIL